MNDDLNSGEHDLPIEPGAQAAVDRKTDLLFAAAQGSTFGPTEAVELAQILSEVRGPGIRWERNSDAIRIEPGLYPAEPPDPAPGSNLGK